MAPGPRFSAKISASLIHVLNRSLAFGSLRSRVVLFLLLLSNRKKILSLSGSSRRSQRAPGRPCRDLYLDDLGFQLGQHLSTGWAGPVVSHVDYADSFQRFSHRIAGGLSRRPAPYPLAYLTFFDGVIVPHHFSQGIQATPLLKNTKFRPPC